MTLAVDALSPSTAGQHLNLGAEASLLGGLLQLRGGYQELFMDESVKSFTAGAGLRYGFGTLDLSADYAYEASEYFGGDEPDRRRPPVLAQSRSVEPLSLPVP